MIVMAVTDTSNLFLLILCVILRSVHIIIMTFGKPSMDIGQVESMHLFGQQKKIVHHAVITLCGSHWGPVHRHALT